MPEDGDLKETKINTKYMRESSKLKTEDIKYSKLLSRTKEGI